MKTQEPLALRRVWESGLCLSHNECETREELRMKLAHMGIRFDPVLDEMLAAVEIPSPWEDRDIIFQEVKWLMSGKKQEKYKLRDVIDRARKSDKLLPHELALHVRLQFPQPLLAPLCVLTEPIQVASLPSPAIFVVLDGEEKSLWYDMVDGEAELGPNDRVALWGMDAEMRERTFEELDRLL